MNELIRKIVDKTTVGYRRLSIVENADGFLLQDRVRTQLREAGWEVVSGSNLQLRIHYELCYKAAADKRFIYVSSSIGTLVADMRREANVCTFSVSDVFPLFADKPLIRKMPYEVLETLYQQAGQRWVSIPEGRALIESILRERKERLLRSAEYFRQQLQAVRIDWESLLPTITAVTDVVARAMGEGSYEGIAPMVDTINDAFQDYIDTNYFAALHSSALLRARSVNNILPHLASNYGKDDKVALLVVDGMAYWQYTLLKRHLTKAGLLAEDGCTLAWLPTITMLSRQAIFRGSDPRQDYVQNPSNEKRLWEDFWRNEHFGTYEIQYISDADEFAINEGVRRLAVVTVEMDEKMHSSSDYLDLHSLTENWCRRTVQQIATIVGMGFTLYLTSDHGGVLSHGWRPLTQVEKVFLYKDGSRGKRHLIYNNAEEQERFYRDNTDISLLRHDNWMSVRDSQCFARDGKTMITHGGSHFMEVVVPLVKIENKQWKK